MTSPDQERWLRVKEKLRAEVGEDIFQSWFARMDLERIEVNTAHLSVPTRFLKSWIQSHYTDRVLACWQGENTDIQKIDVTVRSAMIRTAPPKIKPPEIMEPHRDLRVGRLDIGELRAVYAPVSTGHDALGGSAHGRPLPVPDGRLRRRRLAQGTVHPLLLRDQARLRDPAHGAA